MRGTSTTEYTIVISVVLVIAVIAASLLGFFPGWSGPAGDTAGSTRWAQQRPFSVMDTKPAPGGLQIVMQNQEAGKTKLRKVVLKPVGSDVQYATDANVAFNAGQRATFFAKLPEDLPQGTRFTVGFCYTTADGIDNCNNYDTPLPCTSCCTGDNCAAQCKVAGDACANDAECCLLSCNNAGACCRPGGEFCNSVSDCCDGMCVMRGDNSGSVCCTKSLGDACSDVSECCPGSAGQEIACQQIGGNEAIDDATFCCLSDGSTGCGGNGSSCCSGYCNGDACAPRPDLCGDGMCTDGETYSSCPSDCQCKQPGEAAASPTDCCPGTELYEGYCRVASGDCNNNNECMSGNCNSGQCSSQPKGACDPRCKAGSNPEIVCSGSFDGCSDACKQYGDANNLECLTMDQTSCTGPCAITCTDNGGTCGQNTDCCSRHCNETGICYGSCTAKGNSCTGAGDNSCCEGTTCTFNAPGYTCQPEIICKNTGETCDPAITPNGGCCSGTECRGYGLQGYKCSGTKLGGSSCSADWDCSQNGMPCVNGICCDAYPDRNWGPGTCASNADCCPGQTCKGGTCNFDYGTACLSHSGACGYAFSDSCADYVKFCACHAGTSCGTDSDCCPGFACEAVEHTCYLKTAGQLPQGFVCSADSDCASGSCLYKNAYNLGYCACRPDGAQVAPDHFTECCSKAGITRNGNTYCGASCIEAGRSCSVDSDCCNNMGCELGTKTCSYCNRQGTACTSSYECCSGTCDATGRCA